MLRAVVEEMRSESEAPPNPAARLAAAPVPGPVKHAVHSEAGPAPAGPPVDFEAMLAERDAQIAELQQAVIELSRAAEEGEDGAEREELVARIDTFGRRLDEQERSVRHVLAMLIEWVETGQAPRAAA
jgi:hypothetical protein